MKNQLFLFVLIIGFSFLISCQENTPNPVSSKIDVATAEKMVRDFNENFLPHHSEVMEQNTSDNYVFINGEGEFATKAQMNEILKSMEIAKWDLSNLKVRVFGHVFVATGVNNHSLVSKEDGKTFDYQTAFTYLYQEMDGKLDIVSMQHTHVQ